MNTCISSQKAKCLMRFFLRFFELLLSIFLTPHKLWIFKREQTTVHNNYTDDTYIHFLMFSTKIDLLLSTNWKYNYYLFVEWKLKKWIDVIIYGGFDSFRVLLLLEGKNESKVWHMNEFCTVCQYIICSMYVTASVKHVMLLLQSQWIRNSIPNKKYQQQHLSYSVSDLFCRNANITQTDNRSHKMSKSFFSSHFKLLQKYFSNAAYRKFRCIIHTAYMCF